MRLIYLFFVLLVINFCSAHPVDLLARPLKTGQYASEESIFFLENKGQILDQHGKQRRDVDLRLVIPGVNAFIGRGQIQYQWIKPADTFPQSKTNSSTCKSHAKKYRTKYEIFRLDMKLLHANRHARLVKEEELDYYERYYLPQTPEGITAGSYRKITYKEVYPHIDWVIYIKNSEVEYDFVVHPGGNVTDIQLIYEGADKVELNRDGSLLITTPMGSVTESAPRSFLEDGTLIESLFSVDNNIVRFTTASFDGRLRIDPKLKWATYYGGTAGLFVGAFEDGCVDRLDNYYTAGTTNDIVNIATTGSHQTTLLGSQDAFLVKFSAQGQRLWGTYYGGPGSDDGMSVTVDSSGNVYLCGYTGSTTGIATLGAHQSILGGGSGGIMGGNAFFGDAFLVKFDSSGVRQWGTYYGDTTAGNEYNDYGYSVAYGSGYVYLSGVTESTACIATPGAFKEIHIEGDQDAYLVKFDVNGVRQWGTYFGGDAGEGGGYVTTDKTGNIYLLGQTSSPDKIASKGSFQATLSGINDLYLAKFNDSGHRIWSTYYGGPDVEDLLGSNGVFCDDEGNVYLAGLTQSSAGIATPGSAQPQYSGMNDGLLVKFDSSGKREWATYTGGNDEERAISVFVDKNKNIFLSGATTSAANIAKGNALQPNYSGTGLLNSGDAFLMQYDSLGTKVYGSYFGGPGDDMASHVVMDSKGAIYIGGVTNSVSGIGTVGSHQDTYPGSLLFNAFIAKFCFSTIPLIDALSGKDTVCSRTLQTYTIDADPDAESYIWTLPGNWLGGSDSNSIAVTNDGQGGTLTVQVVRCGDTSLARQLDIYVLPDEEPFITVSGFVLSTGGPYRRYQWLFNGEPITGATAATYKVTKNGTYSVITENAYGCVDTSSGYEITNVGIEGLSQAGASVAVYPNPARQLVYIQAAFAIRVTISGIDGREVLKSEGADPIDISGLTPAIYLLQVFDQEGLLRKTAKLVKDL